jgi:coenzyme PQQ biosynthesis protein PqqD
MIPEGARPKLAARARLREDRISGRTMLLYPERGLALNASAAAIVRLCDAHHTVAEIVAALAAERPEAQATIAADVTALLEALVARGLLTWTAAS